MTTVTVPGNPVHAIALLPGDVIHRQPHDIGGTSTDGQHWEQHIECAEADVRVDRAFAVGPDLADVYWRDGTAWGVTVYSRLGLVPLLRRIA